MTKTPRRKGAPKRSSHVPVLSQAEVVVLSLVLQRPRHGYDIIRQVESMRARMWAKIGTATIYTVLDRLERTGAIRAQRQRKSLGPAKRVVAITPKGRAQFAASVRLLLRSSASVYSDRIVGLAMSAALPVREARREINATLDFLERALQAFEAYRQAEEETLASALVVGFYRDILLAERRACEKWLARASAKKTPTAR